MDIDTISKEVENTVEAGKRLENELIKLEQGLEVNPQFQAYIAKKKERDEFDRQSSEVFSKWQEVMEQKDIKSIKGDWGSITLAERQGWDIDEELLPKKFFKKVVDTKKITDTYRLEGKAPKGATSRVTKYLTKRFK